MDAERNGQPAIEVSNLTRRFGKKTALDDVSISVAEGCVYGLVGENGAGKTTLIKHLLGALKAQSGTVNVLGIDPVKDPVGVLANIGYLSEDRAMPDWMRVRELMRYTQAFYPKWDTDLAQDLLDSFQLDPESKIKTLSRGERALAGLLIALAHRPRLLVFDEPSSGLDPVVRRDILSAIIRTVADEGRTVFFSSHLLEEVDRVSDHVAMMAQGKVILSDPMDAIKDTHHRLVVRFNQAQTSKPTFEGALSIVGENHEWTIVCNGERDRIKASIVEMQATVVEEATPTLEEIFIARARSRSL